MSSGIRPRPVDAWNRAWCDARIADLLKKRNGPDCLSPPWLLIAFQAIFTLQATARMDNLAGDPSGFVPIRPMGDSASHFVFSFGETHPVSVAPGSTEFTVIPSLATSALKLRLKASMAPFVAAYASSPGMGPRPCPEDKVIGAQVFNTVPR